MVATSRGLVLQGALLLSLLIALGVLVVLVGDILIQSLPVFAERPLEFLTSPLSSRPARAGIIQGIIGSVLLMAFVASSRCRSGSAPRSTSRSTRTTRG